MNDGVSCVVLPMSVIKHYGGLEQTRSILAKILELETDKYEGEIQYILDL